MKKSLMVAMVGLSFVSGLAMAAPLHDWRDLDKVHGHVQEAINEMDRAAAANHFDMGGHAAKANEHLHAAERELAMAVQSARAH